MPTVTAVTSVETILIPSSPLIEPQFSSSSNKGVLLPSKYFGHTTIRSAEKDECNTVLVGDSFGGESPTEGKEERDEGLPALEDLFRTGKWGSEEIAEKGLHREKEDAPKPGQQIACGRHDTFWRDHETLHDIREQKKLTGNGTNLVVHGPSSQGGEESTYFKKSNDSVITLAKWAKRKITKPLASSLSLEEAPRSIPNPVVEAKDVTTLRSKEESSILKGQRVKDNETSASAGSTPREEVFSKAKRQKKVKTMEEGQGTIKGAKISKPGLEKKKRSARKPSLDRQRKAQLVTSELGSDRAGSKTAASKVSPLEIESVDLARLGLDKALPRRQNWTPTKHKTTDQVSIRDVEREGSLPPSENDSGRNEPAKFDLEKMIGSFSYSASNSPSVSNATASSIREGVTKRRKVEVCSFELHAVAVTLILSIAD